MRYAASSSAPAHIGPSPAGSSRCRWDWRHVAINPHAESLGTRTSFKWARTLCEQQRRLHTCTLAWDAGGLGKRTTLHTTILSYFLGVNKFYHICEQAECRWGRMCIACVTYSLWGYWDESGIMDWVTLRRSSAATRRARCIQHAMCECRRRVGGVEGGGGASPAAACLHKHPAFGGSSKGRGCKSGQVE